MVSPSVNHINKLTMLTQHKDCLLSLKPNLWLMKVSTPVAKCVVSVLPHHIAPAPPAYLTHETLFGRSTLDQVPLFLNIA